MLRFLCILDVIEVFQFDYENRDFRLSCEKHIVALSSAKTDTQLCSSSGPPGPRVPVS